MTISRPITEAHLPCNDKLCNYLHYNPVGVKQIVHWTAEQSSTLVAATSAIDLLASFIQFCQLLYPRLHSLVIGFDLLAHPRQFR